MQYLLVFGGSPFNPILRDYLIGITVKDEIGLKSDTCDVIFSYDPKFPDFRLGTVMTVKLGDADKLWDTGKYYISEINHQGPPHELIVRGLSSPLIVSKALQDSHRRNWQRGEKHLSEIIRQVVSDVGLLLKYSADEDPLMPYTAQCGETDAEFLMRLARLRGLNFKVDGNNFIAYDIGASKNLGGTSLPTVQIDYVGEDMQYSFLHEELDAYAQAVAWVQQIPQSQRLPVKVGGGSPKFEFKEMFPTIDEARQACQAKLQESNRLTYRAEITVPGQQDIIAGGKMKLSGFPKLVNRTYLIERVMHNFSASSGYTLSASLVDDVS